MNPNTASRILRALSGRPGETTARWLRRAEVQIAFAHAFATLLPPGDTNGWTERIDHAQALLDNFDPNEGLFGLSGAVRAAEKEMEPIGQAAKRYAIHCVGHGHIDMNWMWSWPETVAMTHDTFASVLSLMEQYPDVTFSQSQASVYALVEKYYPEMFAQIQQRVAEGRWEIAAAHWVEGDKNIASGESLCRHLLYTRRYFQEKFGLSAEDLPVDWEPDTFGHAVTVPGILAQGGVKFYYSCRTGGGFDHAVAGQFPRPRLFWWQGPDGSRILVNRESTWYNSYVNIGDNIALPAVEFWRETGLTDWLNVYGIGNHGGGPTRIEIEYYREMQEWPIYPQVVFGTAKKWYEKTATDIAARNIELPVLDHELNFEFTGCYTSQSLIKQANRLGENYLEEAETLAAVTAKLCGKTYPREHLREAWINVLFNQFHDILPGSGVRQTRDHALGLFQEVGAITGSIKRSATRALTQDIDTLSLLPDTPEAREERALADEGTVNTPFVAGAGIRAMESGFSIASGGGKRFRPFVVYNPCAWTRSEPVTVTLYDTGDLEPSRLVARDETGAQHPTLFLGRGNDWGHDKVNLLFLARDIPPLGYRTYLFCEGVADAETPTVTALSDTEFETPYLRLKFDRYQCGIKAVTSKGAAEPQEYGDSFYGLGMWHYVNEQPRGMTAWVLGGENDYQSLAVSGFGVQGVAHNGGTGRATGGSLGVLVHQNVTMPDRESKSTVRLSYLIHALEPRIDVTAEVDWREIGDAKRGIPGLFVEFALALQPKGLASRYETPFGSVTRNDLTDNEEAPTLRYAHIYGKTSGNKAEHSLGFTLLQDSKYGHALDGSWLKMRVIRSSFDPDHAPEVNRQTIRYSMYFHEGEADPATLTRLGAAWNHPLLVFPINLQTGDAPASRSFVQVETPNVVLSALKQAEDGDGLIVRLVELNGEDTEAVVTFDPALTEGVTTAALLDLMERPVEGGAAVWEGNRLRVSVRANSFVTVRLS